jgi:hypothetical protein
MLESSDSPETERLTEESFNRKNIPDERDGLSLQQFLSIRFFDL